MSHLPDEDLRIVRMNRPMGQGVILNDSAVLQVPLDYTILEVDPRAKRPALYWVTEQYNNEQRKCIWTYLLW